MPVPTVEFHLPLYWRFLSKKKKTCSHCRALAAFEGHYHSYKMNLCHVNILTEFFICTSKNDLIISIYVTLIVFCGVRVNNSLYNYY